METTQTSPVEKLAFALVYAENSKPTVKFYKKYFGFTEDPNVKMDGDQVFGSIGPVGLRIGGGYKRLESNEKATRNAFDGAMIYMSRQGQQKDLASRRHARAATSVC